MHKQSEHFIPTHDTYTPNMTTYVCTCMYASDNISHAPSETPSTYASYPLTTALNLGRPAARLVLYSSGSTTTATTTIVITSVS